MLTRTILTALAAAHVLSTSSTVLASGGGGKPHAVRVKPRTGGGAKAPARRVQVQPRTGNSMQRAPQTARQRPSARPATATTRPRPATREQRMLHRIPKPSIAKNVGWGAFWTAMGVASLATGGAGAVGGAVIGGSAAAYNFIKAYLNNRVSTTAEQSRSVAFNAGWGMLFAGMAVHGIIAGDPVSAAVGIGAGAYNLIKAGMNYGQLPLD